MVLINLDIRNSILMMRRSRSRTLSLQDMNVDIVHVHNLKQGNNLHRCMAMILFYLPPCCRGSCLAIDEAGG